MVYAIYNNVDNFLKMNKYRFDKCAINYHFQIRMKSEHYLYLWITDWERINFYLS